jgi:hypothetical protein
MTSERLRRSEFVRRVTLLATILVFGAPNLWAQIETPEEEPLLDAMRLGMSYAEVQSALTKHRPDLFWSGQRARELAVTPLGKGTSLVIKYGNSEDESGHIGLESTVEGIELTHFEDWLSKRTSSGTE